MKFIADKPYWKDSLKIINIKHSLTNYEIFYWVALSFQIYRHTYSYLWKCLKYILSTYLFQTLKVNILKNILEPGLLLSYEILFWKQIKVDKSIIYVQVLFVLELFLLWETESDNVVLIFHRSIWLYIETHEKKFLLISSKFHNYM